MSRKGKPDERRPLLLLFVEAPMSAVFNAADRAVMGPLSEHNYRFLKTLTQVLNFYNLYALRWLDSQAYGSFSLQKFFRFKFYNYCESQQSRWDDVLNDTYSHSQRIVFSTTIRFFPSLSIWRFRLAESITLHKNAHCLHLYSGIT